MEFLVNYYTRPVFETLIPVLFYMFVFSVYVYIFYNEYNNKKPNHRYFYRFYQNIWNTSCIAKHKCNIKFHIRRQLLQVARKVTFRK